ncbi:hypothetical protein LXH13_16535 [Streptomyces spinosirectus]|uniref:hypothetical protein n=1 Tax=Streptomyces TaxID=1883 RepID=UPI000D48A099|nr:MULTISPECIES: hypothetical protein [Streptomyces]MBY8340512.1 hypothetical protein [Streptomyces plumbidurans]PTM92445.1 hypothetical protein C7821_109266 [Streptomyces sp. VMFN-G11Ma]UIR18554.1 hypothetical protein LXH13_16535 [Streptomyces spinosirectus]
MSGRFLPWLGVPLQHGPWIAALAVLAVTPGGLWLLALLLERRLMGFRTGFVAVLLGDPLLAVAVALGVWRMGTAAPGGPAGPWWGIASGGLWLCFGLVQWWAELRAGFFTRQQALAPTKIWHQLVVYPLLGYWLWTAGVGGLRAPGAHVSDAAGRVLIVVCVAGWALINGYDRRRPKLGHPPYDWRRLRPFPQPWPASSRSLRAYRTGTGAGSGADEPTGRR